jgi:outer membrane protein TolC
MVTTESKVAMMTTGSKVAVMTTGSKVAKIKTGSKVEKITTGYKVGIINSFDFNNEKNRLINSQSELLQAKYNYIFSTKVLDFYQGNGISLSK